jgi:tetraacyldisaccharide 4'-kinase
LLNVIKIIASPSVVIYRFMIRVRNWLFDNKWFKSKKVEAKTISVGNITVGGSGKTPMVIAVTKILKNSGINVGVLSRGYGRKSRGYKLAYDGVGKILPPQVCGDEMYLTVDECNVPGAVSERRVEGARKLIADTGVEAIVMDDAFQHRWIHRDLDIVMFDQRFLLKRAIVHHHLLPLGVMREPFSSVDRADIIVINRKFSPRSQLSDSILKLFDSKKVYYGFYEAEGIYDVKTHKRYSISEFVGQKSLVVCGVARPYSFLKVLETNDIDNKNKLVFGDHKHYTAKEIQTIRKKFYEANTHSVLTTQKDAVKLNSFSKELDDIDIFYLKIELKIEEEEDFKKSLMKIFN